MGGERRKYNLVTLTAREHFVAHCLLARCVATEYRSKMWFAVWMFLRTPAKAKRYTNSRLIATAREKVSVLIKMLHTGTKKPHSEATKERIRQARTTQVISKESYLKQAKTLSSLVWMNDMVRSYRVPPNMVEEKLAQGLLVGRLKNHINADFREKMRAATTNHWRTVRGIQCRT